MARKRYSAEQIIGHLRQAEILISEGKTIGEAARQLSISEQTSYRWRREYGGMEVDQARRLKEPSTRAALFRWDDADESWELVGGTIDEDGNTVSGVVNQLGTFALFSSQNAQISGRSLADLSCQPRMISPGGGGFAGQAEVSFTLASDSRTSVRVFDAAGHLVRTLADGQQLFAGSNVLTWDGRDDDGRTVYDGVYVVAVEAGSRSATKVVTVLNGQG